MQFHPTCLYNLEVKNFLITEAVRGEGGQLKLPPGVKGGGKRFMPQFDERAELAPRDIVARAIDHEIKRLGLDYVHLDISHRDPDFVPRAFPQHLREAAGPRHRHHQASRSRWCRRSITPAAAWWWTSTAAPTRPGCTPPAKSPSRGFTAPTASPPTACSNAWSSAKRRRSTSPPIGTSFPTCPQIRAWDESRVTDSDEEVVIAQTWGEIRRFMWNYVGIVRTTKRLERAKHRIDLLRREVSDYYDHFRVTPDLIELRNLVEVADLIIRSALSRHESRGLHYTLDFPELLPEATDTVLVHKVTKATSDD